MSDSSPTIRRKPRRKAPVIRTSQDSPVQPQSKKAVPPSPVPAVSQYASEANTAAEAQAVKAASEAQAIASSPTIEFHHIESPPLCRPPKKAISKRQQMLQNPFLDLQAKEDDSGDSVDGTQNSEDDAFVHYYVLPALICILIGLKVISHNVRSLPQASAKSILRYQWLLLRWRPRFVRGEPFQSR